MLFQNGSDDIIEDLEDVKLNEEPCDDNAGEASSPDEDCYGDSMEEDDDDDSEGWITPGNLKEKQRQMINTGLGAGTNEKIEKVTVACLTTDFAMQV